MTIRAWAPGRVNLIGDHTDYTGGLALPMAIHRGTTITGERHGDHVELRSASADGRALVPLDVADPSATSPPWARYVAGVVHEFAPRVGFVGQVTSDLPIGAGLSSSASLEVAVALALGADDAPAELARRCQRAEQAASGVPCGVMDQLSVVSGLAGHALLLDCHAVTVEPVPIPDGAAFVVVDSGQRRGLIDSEYAARRGECEAAEREIGPLRLAGLDDLGVITDAVRRRRARHVVTENARVRAVADALGTGDLGVVGALMSESHRSLRDDFDVSTPTLDALVDRLVGRPGVHGARLTGAGFGGSVIALVEPGTDVGGWPVEPAGAARCEIS